MCAGEGAAGTSRLQNQVLPWGIFCVLCQDGCCGVGSVVSSGRLPSPSLFLVLQDPWPGAGGGLGGPRPQGPPAESESRGWGPAL